MGERDPQSVLGDRLGKRLDSLVANLVSAQLESLEIVEAPLGQLLSECLHALISDSVVGEVEMVQGAHGGDFCKCPDPGRSRDE